GDGLLVAEEAQEEGMCNVCNGPMSPDAGGLIYRNPFDTRRYYACSEACARRGRYLDYCRVCAKHLAQGQLQLHRKEHAKRRAERTAALMEKVKLKPNGKAGTCHVCKKEVDTDK